MSKVNVIFEAGINYAYGDDTSRFLEQAKRLIRLAATAGADTIKLQKRNCEVSIPEHKKNEKRIVPWRDEPTTYLQYKKDIEFGYNEYAELAAYAISEGIHLFASVWDVPSAEFMIDFSPMVKIPSAKVTDLDLLEYCRENFDTRIMSTGMSTEEEIEEAIEVLEPHVIMHTNSVYPTSVRGLKMGYIQHLQDKHTFMGYPEIGYSNHYPSSHILYLAMGMGATWLETHITENRMLWGSDQASSMQPEDMMEIMKSVRDFEAAIDDGNDRRTLFPGEEIKRKDLRGE